MSAPTGLRRPLRPEPTGVLYPVQPSRAPSRCWRCWQPQDSGVPDCIDPRDGELRRLCRGCYLALSTDTPIILTEQQRAEAWEWLARQHINQRAAGRAGLPLEGTGVTDDHIDSALCDLAPRLGSEEGWLAVEQLEESLLLAQATEDSTVDYHALVDNAVRVLVRGAS